MKKKTMAVLGLGLFGSAVARQLAENGVDVIAIDKNMDHVEEVLDFVNHAVQADFTKIDQLMAAGVENAEVAIVATGERLEITILGIMNLRKLGIPEVVVKTKNIEYKEVLLKVGASRVVLPEVEMGVRLAQELSSTDVLKIIELDERVSIVEHAVHKEWIGKTLKELNFREKYGFNVIAIHSHVDDSYSVTIDPEYILNEKDALLIVMEEK